MQDSELTKFLLGTLPIGVLGMIGWVAHNLSREEPIQFRRFVGGALLAGFTAWISTSILMSMNFPGPMAACFGAFLGASGFEGFQWFVRLIKKQIDPGVE